MLPKTSGKIMLQKKKYSRKNCVRTTRVSPDENLHRDFILKDGDEMTTLGERIREVRKSNQLNQIEFANIIGVSQGTISELEQDKYKPSIDILIAIRDKFHVDLEWLINGSAEVTYCVSLNDKENKLVSGFRKLNDNDQDEIFKIMELKLKRYL